MRLAALLLLASCSWGQVTITYSRQHPAILKAYVQHAPKDIGLYRAMACNVGTADALFSPDTVLREANKTVAVQDPDAALFAGQTAKNASVGVRLLDVGMDILKYGGMGVAIAGTSGIAAIPPIISGVVGGAAVFGPELLKKRDALAQQPIPAKWLTDGMTQLNLHPQQCQAFLFAAVGSILKFDSPLKETSLQPPALKFSGSNFTASPNELGIRCMPINGGACTDGTFITIPTNYTDTSASGPCEACSLGSEPDSRIAAWLIGVTTRPQIDDEYTPERIASMVRAHSAEIGAGQ